MVYCEECYGKIKEKDFKSIYKVTFGNMRKEIFRGRKTIYYHKDCISIKDLSE